MGRLTTWRAPTEPVIASARPLRALYVGRLINGDGSASSDASASVPAG